ncbi:helix-turn-helix domain-containing protein [Aquifex aeolicus]|uniref:helix-turn-helix domain-containing protein n=1 Tax=Aquifex aeolicus TaxID=63363 RepID=UPI00031947FC|nr:helix-turn-helix transcriptional regulator [Aquifex aeolicus]
MIGVGERIRKIREERGMSLEEFAKAIGISTKKLEEIEKGISRPCDATLVFIAKRFNVDYRWLALGERAKEPAGVT